MANGSRKRDWPIETLVTVMRNALRENNWGGTKGKRALKLQREKEESNPTKPAGRALAFEPNLFGVVSLYPFTKGIDLTNDGLGYGEETEVTLQLNNGERILKRSRRTRTGSRCLMLGNSQTATAAVPSFSPPTSPANSTIVPVSGAGYAKPRTGSSEAEPKEPRKIS